MGLTLSHTRAHVARAVLEGIAYQVSSNGSRTPSAWLRRLDVSGRWMQMLILGSGSAVGQVTDVIKGMVEDSGVPIRTMRVDGGVCKSDPLLQ